MGHPSTLGLVYGGHSMWLGDRDQMFFLQPDIVPTVHGAIKSTLDLVYVDRLLWRGDIHCLSS
jgi:hypothetical protein